MPLDAMKLPPSDIGARASYACCDRILFAVAMFGAACLFAAMSVIVIDVLTRRSIDVSIAGTVDLTQLFVMACAFFAIPYAFLRDAHVGVEFVTDALPPRGVLAVKAMASLLSCAFMAAILVSSYGQALLQIGNGDRSQTIAIPIVWYWAPLLCGFGLSVLATLMVALRHLSMAAGRPDLAAGSCRSADAESVA